MENQPFLINNVMENLGKQLSSNTNQTTKPSIYQIPDFIKEVQPKAFEPKLVSLGPYHHGKPHLRSMELAKLDLFHQFLSTYGLEVGFVVKGVCVYLEELRRSYEMVQDDKWKRETERLLQLLVVDGCFVIEFLTNCPQWLKNMMYEIRRDMLMLENQLPMKLLDELCSMAKMDKLDVEVNLDSI